MQTRARWTSIACLAAVALASVASPVQAQRAAEPPPFPSILSSGEHVARVAPDVAWIDVVAETRAKTPREAQALNAAAMTAVQQKLGSAGVPAGALRTRGLDLRPEFDYANGKQTLREYVAINTLELRIEPLDRVGELIDLAVNAGAARVDGFRVDVKRRAELEREALRHAVEDARRRAEAMVAGAGRTLGPVLRMEASVPEPPGPRPFTRMAMAAAAPPPPQTPVSAGEVEVRASVRVVFAIGEP